MSVGQHDTWNLNAPAANSQGSSRNEARLQSIYAQAPYRALNDDAVRRQNRVSIMKAMVDGTLQDDGTIAAEPAARDGYLINGYNMQWASNMPENLLGDEQGNPTIEATADKTNRFTPNLKIGGSIGAPAAPDSAMDAATVPTRNSQFGHGNDSSTGPRTEAEAISSREFDTITLPALNRSQS